SVFLRAGPARCLLHSAPSLRQLPSTRCAASCGAGQTPRRSAAPWQRTVLVRAAPRAVQIRQQPSAPSVVARRLTGESAAADRPGKSIVPVLISVHKLSRQAERRSAPPLPAETSASAVRMRLPGAASGSAAELQYCRADSPPPVWA